MSPHQQAEAITTDPVLVELITTAIQAASNEQLERGRKRTAEAQAALQAALEDLAQVAKERDELKGIESRQGDIIAKTGEVALNRIVKLERERDGLAARLADSGDRMARIRNERDELQAIVEDLSAHDRQVAARVLRHAESLVPGPLLLTLAYEYEDGEREVPGE